MGICPGFALLLRQSLLRGNTTLPLKVVDPNTVLNNTSVLLVDLTQLLYVGRNAGGRPITRTYPDMESFVESSDPIGDIEVRDGRVENSLNVFSEDTAVDIIVQRILSIPSKWSAYCRKNRVKNNLHTIYIVLDGDSPVAKNETRKLRNAKRDVYYILKSLQGRGMDLSEHEGSLRRRCYQTAQVDGHTMEGSLRRYLVQRENRSSVIDLSIDSLRGIECKGDVNLILVKGMEKESPMGRVTQIWGRGQGANLSDTVPYYEADSIIPYIWAKMRSRMERACIISCDSDMMLTLIALGDPSLYLWNSTSLDGIESRGVARGKVVLSCNMDRVSPKTHLNLLTHLTMGGCDYAESLPHCGAVRLMKGCEQILGHQDSMDLFPNIRFATMSDIGEVEDHHERAREVVRLDHSQILEHSQTWLRIKQLAWEREDIFPVRLGKYLYLVVLSNGCSGKILEAYNGMGRARCFTLLSDQVCNRFHWSMKRRLFFLSFVSESRMGLEQGMVKDECIAAKCGLSFGNFLYVNKVE
jgi:hypothetical protein